MSRKQVWRCILIGDPLRGNPASHEILGFTGFGLVMVWMVAGIVILAGHPKPLADPLQRAVAGLFAWPFWAFQIAITARLLRCARLLPPLWTVRIADVALLLMMLATLWQFTAHRYAAGETIQSYILFGGSALYFGGIIWHARNTRDALS